MKNIPSLVLKFNLILIFLCSTISFAQEKDIDVPYIIIEDIPRFQNCNDISIEQAKECFNLEMNKHIQANFRYPKKAFKNKIQGRVTVMFVINLKGDVYNIKTKAPDGCELLEAEAERIIKLLPKFRPGMQKGKPVNVSYSQPILFKL